MHDALRFARLGMPYRLSTEVADAIKNGPGSEALGLAAQADAKASSAQAAAGVTPADYGAMGNGADEAAAIHAMLDDTTQSGATVNWGSGEYRFSRYLCPHAVPRVSWRGKAAVSRADALHVSFQPLIRKQADSGCPEAKQAAHLVLIIVHLLFVVVVDQPRDIDAAAAGLRSCGGHLSRVLSAPIFSGPANRALSG